MNRPKTSQMVIDEFTKLVDSGDLKGIAEYGVSIDEAIDADYDWKNEALSEAADLQKYLVKRIKELEVEVKKLRATTRYNTYMEIHQENLRLAQENKQLRDDKELLSKLYVETILKEE